MTFAHSRTVGHDFAVAFGTQSAQPPGVTQATIDALFVPIEADSIDSSGSLDKHSRVKKEAS
jgi:hypothetical protein